MASPLTETNPKSLDWDAARAEPERELLHLVIAWSREEPHRIGEAAPIEGRCVLGRDAPQPDEPVPRARFYQQRPSEALEMPPLEGSRFSRRQLELSPLPDGALEVTSVGRCPLILHGEVVQRGIVRPGDTVTLQSALVLLVVRRRPQGPPLRAYAGAAPFPFGVADPHGIVGESPAAWALRDALAFAAQAGHHVLVQGASGVGKELAARAIHALSPRRGRAFVARNAATFPEGLVDAELFGNARGYPHAGSPERRGLIGEADGGTLFLDEIGELPHGLQVHLLRALDHGGEYQRLGDAQARRSDFRLVAATNRPIDALKHDLAARFAIRVEVPGLERRREDIPLLLQHLLAAVGRANPDLSSRYFERRAGAPAEARVDPQVIDALLRHGYTHHLREMERLLWVALGTSRHSFLTLTAELRAELRLGAPAPAPGGREAGRAPALPARAPRPHEPPGGGDDEPAREGVTDPGAVGRAEIEAALSKGRGKIARAARLLGLKNRFVLYRLMKRYGLASPEDDDTEA